MKKNSLLFFLVVLLCGLSVKAQDSLTVIVKLRSVNVILGLNSGTAAMGDLEHMVAVRFDTDDNIATGDNGYDLEMSLTHYKESDSKELATFKDLDKKFWLLDGTSRVPIGDLAVTVNQDDSTIVMRGSKSAVGIAAVKEGQNFMALTYTKDANDHATGGVIPKVLTDAEGDCEMAPFDIKSIEVKNANPAPSAIRPVRFDAMVNIYPQPLIDKAILKISTANTLPMSLNIYNMQGQLVQAMNGLSAGTVTIERNNLPAGLYFYNLSTFGQLIHTGKIMIGR